MAHESDNLAAVPPGQHRRRDAIARAQVLLGFAAAGVAAAFWTAGGMFRGEARYSPQPLAQVHAASDARCADCHVGAEPLAGDNWLATLTGKTHVADAQCRSCHRGPQHHANERVEDVPSCASCHREHQGRMQVLTRVADAWCTSCHRDLHAHVANEKTTPFLDVASFADQAHPEFRWLRDKLKDPGKVAFNHALHLTPGLRAKAGSAAPGSAALFTLGDIPAELRQRYRTSASQQDQDPVQLDCASCHRLDHDGAALADGLPAAARPVRPGGATMLPIIFEQHCQACHPLTFAPASSSGGKAAAVRHRLQPEELHPWLRGHFTLELLQGKLPVFERSVRPLPGKSPLPDDDAKKVRELLDARIHAAEAILYGPSTCRKCHTGLDLSLGSRQRVPPAGIPQLWLAHARFDHTAHRAVDCRRCHERAFPLAANGAPNPDASTSQADVLLPGVATCLKCHGPFESGPPEPRGGVRHDCALCHRYHAGDHPLHGRGTSLRGP